MNIFLIGCGSIGKKHISNLLKLKVNNITIFDKEKQRMEEFRNTKKITICNNLLEGFKYKPCAVFICTPPNSHIYYGIESVKRNCNLFIEKPLSSTVRNVEKLLTIAKRKKLLIMIGHNLRFNKSLIRIKKMIDSKVIGKIISARVHCGSYLPYRHPGEDYRKGYGAKKELGGGPILDFIHEIDYISWFFGNAEELFAYFGRFSGLKIDTEDSAEVLFKFKNGVIVSLHLDYIQRPYTRKCEIIGEKGTILWDLSIPYNVKLQKQGPFKDVLELYNIKTGKWEIFHNREKFEQSYFDEDKYFLKCIKNRIKPPVDGEFALRVLKIVEAIRESSEKKKLLKI